MTSEPLTAVAGSDTVRRPPAEPSYFACAARRGTHDWSEFARPEGRVVVAPSDYASGELSYPYSRG
jgi:hypothetical protein